MSSIRRAPIMARRIPTLGSKIPGPPPGGYGAASALPHTPAIHRGAPQSGMSLVHFFFWIIFLVSSAIAYLWAYNQTDVVALELVETQALIKEIENTNRDLQTAIDQLSQIDRITRIARQELNMVTPAAESLFVYLPELPR